MNDFYPIKIGEIYPNYKALCKQLSEPVKTGGAKINQLVHWQTCFLWEKHKNKYKITHIIRPLDQRLHKQRENSKWYKSVATILLNKLADTVNQATDSSNYNSLVLTSTEAYLTLGLCNGKFQYLKSINLDNILLEHQLRFYRLASEKFYYILTNALNSLKNQKIIGYARRYRVKKKMKILQD